MLEKIVLTEKLKQITDHWRPRVVGRLNGQEVKLVKFKGTFVWHKHDGEDELFMPVKGRFSVELRDGAVDLQPGELLIVPRGVEHRTVAEQEVEALLFEPAGTKNTGDVEDEVFTARFVPWL
jgi:mannose-6-phosphate isomerase-like protein (cupin superfamily)